MTVSGVSTWNPAVTFMVRQSLINVGAIAEDEEPTGQQYSDGVFQLNAMVKSLEATGLHVWTEQEAILFLQVGQPKYVIGNGGTAHTSDADQWEQLSLQSSVLAGSPDLPFALVLGVSVNDSIGVVLDSGLTFWSTVSAVSDTSITLADPLPSSASGGNFVLVYTTPILRPLKVPKARLLTFQPTGGAGPSETPMTVLSRQGYMDLPNKLSPGVPTQWFYSPQRDQGYFYVWPVPIASNWAVRFTWYRPLQDYLVPNDTSDFPQEWINPLIWNLAHEMGPSYSVPPAKWAMIEKMAEQWGDVVLSYDRESEDVQFGLDYTNSLGY
jgi:hypothetical protein